MSSKRLHPDVYKNLQKLKLSADTKSGTVEETITLEKPSDDEDTRLHYWFILMLSFGQRSGYVYDRSGLHIPEPDTYVYSVEMWKFKGSTLKGVETISNKVDFDEAIKTFQRLKDEITAEGFKIMQ
ncbi:MAG: hypothetical protein ACTSQF_16175 [Candidatus Heimdallarchaeaceae archaeon]